MYHTSKSQTLILSQKTISLVQNRWFVAVKSWKCLWRKLTISPRGFNFAQPKIWNFWILPTNLFILLKIDSFLVLNENLIFLWLIKVFGKFSNIQHFKIFPLKSIKFKKTLFRIFLVLILSRFNPRYFTTYLTRRGASEAHRTFSSEITIENTQSWWNSDTNEVQNSPSFETLLSPLAWTKILNFLIKLVR